MNINTPLQGASIALPFTKAADPTKRHEVVHLRIPFANRVPDNVRNHFVAMCGEYVGTVLFLYMALGGTQVANNIPSSSGLTVQQTGSNPQQLQYIALCFGFSLAVNAWVFFRISGGLFNPAVTFGMCFIGALPWFRGFLLLIVQILGGLTAAALVSCMFPGTASFETTLGGGTTVVQGLFIEMILTAMLVFTIFMLAAEKHKGTFIAPVGIGLALFVTELVGVYFTGGSLNPARSFGPCAVNHSFTTYQWIYWLGPFLGSFIAAGFYKFIKVLEYETANPDQDSDHAVQARAKAKADAAAAANSDASEKEEVDMRPTSSQSRTERPVSSHSKLGKGPRGLRHLHLHRPHHKARVMSNSPAMAHADEAFHGVHDDDNDHITGPSHSPAYGGYGGAKRRDAGDMV